MNWVHIFTAHFYNDVKGALYVATPTFSCCKNPFSMSRPTIGEQKRFLLGVRLHAVLHVLIYTQLNNGSSRACKMSNLLNHSPLKLRLLKQLLFQNNNRGQSSLFFYY